MTGGGYFFAVCVDKSAFAVYHCFVFLQAEFMGFDLYDIVALLIVVTIHEYSHALVAYKLGDPTAKLAGRISLNPLAHLDPVGTLMILFAHIGWGKPVPVNPSYFKQPKRDQALTALAGPFSSLVLAFLMALIIKYFGLWLPGPLGTFSEKFFVMSLGLFIFNMFPFPPLDGSKIVGIFVPQRFQRIYQNYLRNGTLYFVIFLVLDQFVLARFFNYSILGDVIGKLFTFFETLLFLGN